jgi:Fe-S cluster biosynthesis and repair protein YggX
MARIVECAKLGRLLPGLDQPPFPGEFGQRIYENISAEAYGMWQQFSTILINHHGLSLGNPQHRDFLMEQMEEFFFGEGARMPDDWVPPGQPGAKGGAPAAAGAKGGAPAPRKK